MKEVLHFLLYRGRARAAQPATAAAAVSKQAAQPREARKSDSRSGQRAHGDGIGHGTCDVAHGAGHRQPSRRGQGACRHQMNRTVLTALQHCMRKSAISNTRVQNGEQS